MGVFNIFALLFYVSYARTIFNNPGTPLKASELSNFKEPCWSFHRSGYFSWHERKVIRD